MGYMLSGVMRMGTHVHHEIAEDYHLEVPQGSTVKEHAKKLIYIYLYL